MVNVSCSGENPGHHCAATSTHVSRLGNQLE